MTLLKPSVYDPTPERLKCRAEKYSADKNIFVYACKIDSVYAGIVVLKTENDTAEILDIAVKPEYRRNISVVLSSQKKALAMQVLFFKFCKQHSCIYLSPKLLQ